ncbi:hypothetical protein D3C87_1624870 [compost metagenome]
MHNIDGDASGPEVSCQTFGPTDQCRLAHRVQAHTRVRHSFGEVTAGGNDSASFWQINQCCLRGQQHRSYVDCKGVIDVFNAHSFNRATTDDARVIDQDIEPTQFSSCAIDCLSDRIWRCCVHLDRDRAAAGVV